MDEALVVRVGLNLTPIYVEKAPKTRSRVKLTLVTPEGRAISFDVNESQAHELTKAIELVLEGGE